MSYAEDIFEESLLLILSQEEIKRNYRPNWLKNPETGKPLEYDFFIPKLKIAFEIQGPHYYTSSEQIYRDSIKESLSNIKNIKLIKCSIFQLRQEFIRKHILDRIHNLLPYNIKILKFDKTKNDVLSLKIKKYKNMIISSYGRNDCHLSPTLVDLKNLRLKIREFLKINGIFYIKINGKQTPCEYLRERTRFLIKIGGRTESFGLIKINELLISNNLLDK